LASSSPVGALVSLNIGDVVVIVVVTIDAVGAGRLTPPPRGGRGDGVGG